MKQIKLNKNKYHFMLLIYLSISVSLGSFGTAKNSSNSISTQEISDLLNQSNSLQNQFKNLLDPYKVFSSESKETNSIHLSKSSLSSVNFSEDNIKSDYLLIFYIGFLITNCFLLLVHLKKMPLFSNTLLGDSLQGMTNSIKEIEDSINKAKEPLQIVDSEIANIFKTIKLENSNQNLKFLEKLDYSKLIPKIDNQSLENLEKSIKILQRKIHKNQEIEKSHDSSFPDDDRVSTYKHRERENSSCQTCQKLEEENDYLHEKFESVCKEKEKVIEEINEKDKVIYKLIRRERQQLVLLFYLLLKSSHSNSQIINIDNLFMTFQMGDNYRDINVKDGSYNEDIKGDYSE